MPFRSLEQAAKYSPIIEEAMVALNVKTHASLWSNLRTAFPGLKKTALNVKGTREAGQARKAARRILGREPMYFNPKIHQGHPLTRRVMDPAYEYTFTWQQVQRNVFLDGGKVDPQAWVKSQKGITQLGAARTPICYNLLMKTVSDTTACCCCSPLTHCFHDAAMVQVGMAPKVMFYIFASAVTGTLLVTAANGSKAADSVQAGLQRWTDKIDDETKLAIMKMHYGSSEKAVQKFRKASPQEAAKIFPVDQSELVPQKFTGEGFLV